MLDEDTFNLEVRKLLKTFGVGAQREIEKAVDDALGDGRLTGDEALSASIRLEIPELDLRFTTDGDIRLRWHSPSLAISHEPAHRVQPARRSAACRLD